MDATQLAEKHGLTQREAEVVLARKSQGGASLEDHVAQIRSERVGPSALPEGSRTDLNEPGSGISPPSPTTPPTPQEHLADLQRRRAALDEEITAAEEAVTASELQARTTAPAPEPARTLSDEEIRDATAADLAAYVAANPGEKRRVRRFELDREGGPRKTVTDALEAT